MSRRGRTLALSTFAVVALVAGLLTPTVANAATVSEAEPNNTTAAAQTLALGNTVNATFAANGVCDNNFYDCDYYKITAPQQGLLTLDVRFSDSLGTSGSFALSVLNASGATTHSLTVSSAHYDGSALRSRAIYVDAGVNYVFLKTRVDGFSGSTYLWAGQSYTLTTSLTPTTAETEPNASTASADLIAMGATVSGSALSADCGNYDCDYFRVQLSAAAKLTVDFRFVCNLGTDRVYYLSTFDNAGTRLTYRELKGPDCSGSAVRATAISAPAGNFYVKVEGRTTSAGWAKTYTLKISSTLTATPTPKIVGTAKVGSTLTVSTGTWSPAPVTLGYQWLRNGAVIPGAAGPSYTLVGSDYKKTITVRVTGSKAGFGSVTKTSAATATVKAGTLSPAPTPTISGTRAVGNVLTATPGTWGPAPVTVTYQWYRDGKAISGATGSTYKLKSTDRGTKTTVRVTAKKSGYTTATRTSTATPKIAAGTLTTSVPSISGTPAVGSTVTSVFSTWGPSPVSMSYQWLRNGTPISGATSATYKLKTADAGKTVTLRITGKKTGYTTVSVVSSTAITVPAP